jgi:hypothetical protein
MRINYNKIKKISFNKSNVNNLFKEKEKIEKKIEKLEKKIEEKVEKLDIKIQKQIKNNKEVFNIIETEELVELETQQDYLEQKVKTLEETIDELEEKENIVLNELI